MLTLERIEGKNLNYFCQSGPVSAHVLLTSGENPRALVAFPAGNSGVAVWFKKADSKLAWVLKSKPKPVVEKDAQGRPLYGVTFEASVQVPSLSVENGLLSNVRVIRDAQATGYTPHQLITYPKPLPHGMEWQKDRLDGAACYRLTITALHGTFDGTTFQCGANGWIDLKFTALSGETPLTPLTSAELFNGTQLKDEGMMKSLRFLSYREKFLAGSWRFNTYFGRDTLISMRLLMPVLTAGAIQNGLGSVLDRLSPDGEVAHEEDLAEFAVYEHERDSHIKSDAPIFNYAHIDGAFLLPPIATDWLLAATTPRAEAQAFLAKRDRPADRAQKAYGDDLLTNFRFALKQLAPFAQNPIAANLLHLRSSADTGNWRDSGDGNGNGRIPYDVNGVLAPATLHAIQRLYESGLLQPYFQPGDAELFAKVSEMTEVWRKSAKPLFAVSVPEAAARAQVAAYAAESGIPAVDALKSLPAGVLRFHAIALDGHEQPIPILHSDEGFALLFTDPDPAELEVTLASVMRPFPAGLRTDAGMVVANPAFASAGLKAKFTKNAYHGAVVWSWQQALMAAGIERQLRRTDLPTRTVKQLLDSQTALWQAIDAGRLFKNSELWSWSWSKGKFHVAAFGENAKDVDESNAAQLWSTVYLAVQKPKPNSRLR